jgi:hypothetical protein
VLDAPAFPGVVNVSFDMQSSCHNEGKLEIERLLAPQGSVVIEDRDPLFRFDELRAPGRRHSADKIEDALFRGTFVPGRKWINACH